MLKVSELGQQTLTKVALANFANQLEVSNAPQELVSSMSTAFPEVNTNLFGSDLDLNPVCTDSTLGTKFSHETLERNQKL